MTPLGPDEVLPWKQSPILPPFHRFAKELFQELTTRHKSSFWISYIYFSQSKPLSSYPHTEIFLYCPFIRVSIPTVSPSLNFNQLKSVFLEYSSQNCKWHLSRKDFVQCLNCTLFLREYLPQYIFSSHLNFSPANHAVTIRIFAVSWELFISLYMHGLTGFFLYLITCPKYMCSADAFPQLSCTDNIPQFFVTKFQHFLVPKSLLKTMQGQVSTQSLGKFPYC